MFSKINGEFTKHAKGFQILLGLMIVVPFVIMVPNTDVFGPGYVDESKSIVGAINNEDIIFSDYEVEARRFLLTQSFTDVQNGTVLSVLQNYRNIIRNESLVPEVLNYIARNRELEAQNAANKFSTESVSREEIKEVVNGLSNALHVLKVRAQQSNNSFELTVKETLELLRKNLQIGGEEIDLVIERIVMAKRFDEYLKKKVAVKDEDVIARIKKEEKTYKVRTAEVSATNYKNDPLKDYYEKNKDTFFDKEAIKASLVVFDPQKYKAEILKTDLTKEIEKAFAEEKKTNDKAQENAKSIKESLKDRIAQDKAKEKAKSTATLIESNLKAKIKPEMKTEAILTAFNNLAKASKLTVQESNFHNKQNVEKNDHPINAKVTEAILSLSEKDPVKLLDDQSKYYVLVYNAKGYYQPIEKVRTQLLEAVYKDKAADYYKDNLNDFKQEQRLSTAYIRIFGGLFNSQVSISDEDAKKVYDADSSYQNAQKKLLQFTYDLKEDAKEEDKKAAVAAIEAFVKENASKKAEELQKIDLGKDSKIKRVPLSWVAENDLRTGTDNEIVSEAFKTEDAKFTKIFERDKFAAVVFVEASRESTPFDEVKVMIKGSLRTNKLKEITNKKADEIVRKLQNAKKGDKEAVTKIIEEVAKELKITPNKLADLPTYQVLSNPQLAQYTQFLARQNGISPSFLLDLTSLSNDRLFTRVKTQPNMSKVIGYLIEDKPAGFQTLEEVTETVYDRLNDGDAEKIAADKAVALKEELENSVDKPEEFKTLMSKNGFKEAKDVKFKDADPTILKILEEDPKANQFGSNPAPNGRVTTLAFIESVKEVAEENITKVKAEYEKKIREESERKEIADFWTNAMKKYDIKTVQSSKES